MAYAQKEKAVTIRYPATANLMIDSQDQVSQSGNPPYSVRINPWSFQIAKSNSLFNGFFSRIGTTEVVLEWNNPNIKADLSNNVLPIDISGTPYIVPINDGFYTVEQLLDYIETWIDANTIANMTINSNPAVIGDWPTNIEFNAPVTFLPSKLTFQLGLPLTTNTTFFLNNVDLRPYRYIDFVSSQLTYNQDLKDSSTALLVRDVLCRWYFCYDETITVDAYGFPILMGYTPFYVRRIFNPPKQIAWQANMPIGQISFEVFGNDGNLVTSPVYDGKSNWLMTLQVSEN